MNIVDYVERKMEDFKSSKFNPVDSLVLSQFAYLNFNNIVPGLTDDKTPVRIGDLLKAEYIPHMLNNTWDPESNRRFLIAMGMSPRFRDIKMCCYSDSVNIDDEKQFAAITYLLDDKTAYIAYRGTDMTIVGWKEDFNMAFISPIPSQLEGLSYLNAVAERFSHKLMVGGHSKGGNIAVFSAMECHPAVQDRIITVYSHDGPGFKEEVFSSEKYKKIKGRIHKTLPQSSLVGMLLHHQEDYYVVKSKEFWIMQHNPFSWVIDKDDFEYVEDITGGAKHVNMVINQWLSSLDDEKRELFVSTLFGVFESMGVVNFSDFTEDWRKKAVIAMKTIKGIDSETKAFVFETIKSLLSMYLKTSPFRPKLKLKADSRPDAEN
ncbi:MAG: DUF2974 domain-containing protein [Tissierellia bacterium]|nr:DUF2974 domain-containing protein [Tissierellia bacterium]